MPDGLSATVSSTGPRPYTVPEAADELRVSRPHMYNLVKRGTVRAILLGRRKLIPHGEVERLKAGLAA